MPFIELDNLKSVENRKSKIFIHNKNVSAHFATWDGCTNRSSLSAIKPRPWPFIQKYFNLLLLISSSGPGESAPLGLPYASYWSMLSRTPVAATDEVAAALPCGRVCGSAHEHYSGRLYAWFSRRGNQTVHAVPMKAVRGRGAEQITGAPEVSICYIYFSFSR